MADIYQDVVFSHEAAADAIRTINQAVRDTESVLRHRAQDMTELHRGWEGYARDRYEEWCLGFDVVAIGILEALRNASVAIRSQQLQAQEIQSNRLRMRAEIAEQQRREQLAREQAAEDAREAQERERAAEEATR